MVVVGLPQAGTTVGSAYKSLGTIMPFFVSPAGQGTPYQRAN